MRSAELSFLEVKATGLETPFESVWNNTAPIANPDASVSTVDGRSGSNILRTGALLIASLRLLKARSLSSSQEKAVPSPNNAVRGRAIEANYLMYC